MRARTLRPALLALGFAALAGTAATQQRTPALSGNDLAALNDEFTSPASLAGWKQFHETEGWPSMVGRVAVDPAGPGTLQVGLNAYTDWYTAEPMHGDPLKFNTTVVRDGKPDLALEVDWVRFERPAARP
jgi:hypothetical protein